MEQMSIYKCDPELNVECRKTECGATGGGCLYTRKEECRAGQTVTKETRLASWAQIRETLNARENRIFEILLTGSKTAEEVAEVLADDLGYYDRNAAAPRMTEMERRGVLKIIGKRQSRRSRKNIAVYSIA